MTADDDDDGLKSLRAVWLSMPDEDPPERGLADLMAAARVKANEMTVKPSLWQRFMESLRRPPVLALATVMVLIGGAVLVSNRSKDMDAQPTVTAPEAQSGTATVVTESAARDEGRAPSAGSAAAEATPSVPPTIVGGAALEQAPAEEPTAVAPPMKRPEPRASKDTARKENSATTKSVTVESKKSDTLGRGRDDVFLDSDGEGDQLKQESTTRPSGGTTTGTSGTASPKTQAPSDSAALSSAPSVTQMHQSARAAAARGDCDAARTISRTIEKQDPAYYKAKVVNDATFTRCVVAQ